MEKALGSGRDLLSVLFSGSDDVVCVFLKR
jgi:hypothetical protein